MDQNISKHLYTIVLVCVKYKYQKLPTGVCNIPNVFQQKISIILEGLYILINYIYNIMLITKHNSADYLKALEKVPWNLVDSGLKLDK